MKIRARFIYTSLLLCVALLLTCFTATGTIQAYQHFQQDQKRVQSGDVTTVRPWMTIPYVAHVYRVPERCFTQALRLNDGWLVEHATLRVLADHYQRSLTIIIHNIQQVIVNYRRKQLTCGPPPKTTTTPGTHTLPFSIKKGQVP